MVDLSRCVYHLRHVLPSILSGILSAFQPRMPSFSLFSSKQFHLLSRSFSAGDLFIYSNHIQQSSSYICLVCTSFIFTTQNTPRKMSLSSSLTLYPKLSRKDSFSHFRPLPYIPHEKWGYHHPRTSTQNFPGNIGFPRVFQGDLSDNKQHEMDDNYTTNSPTKNRLKI